MTAVLLPSFISLAVVVLGLVFNRRKTGAETSKLTVDVAISLLKPLQEQFDRMQERVELLEAEATADRERIIDLEKGIDILTAQIVELNHEPRWTRT